MRFADYKLKSIQEAVKTAPQGEVNLDHLYEDEPDSAFSAFNPSHAEALSRAAAFKG